MRRLSFSFLLALLSGCGEQPPSAQLETGAKQATEAFYSALIRRDSQRAYDLLDDSSRKRITPEAFTRLVDQYSRNLGFAAEKVYVKNCEEQGDRAVAHVVLSGHSHRYEDGITLTHAGARWGVVLPDNFSRSTR